MSTNNQSDHIQSHDFSGLLENDQLTYIERTENQVSTFDKLSLSQLLSSEDSNLTDRNFQSSRIIIVHPFYQLIPTSHFTEGMEQKAMAQIVKNSDDYSVKQFDWPEDQITGIFCLSSNTAQTLYRWNVNIEIDHIANSHYKLVLNSQDLIGRNGIYAHFCSKNLHILSFMEGRLILSNLFQFETEADILYYILASFKDAKLSPQSDTLYLSGEIDRDGSIYKKLWDFIRNIDWVKPETTLKAGNSVSVPDHYLQIFS